jgi:hypothetical protein
VAHRHRHFDAVARKYIHRLWCELVASGIFVATIFGGFALLFADRRWKGLWIDDGRDVLTKQLLLRLIDQPQEGWIASGYDAELVTNYEPICGVLDKAAVYFLWLYQVG